MKDKIINWTVLFAFILAFGIAFGLGGADDRKYEVEQSEKYRQELRENM